MKSSVADILLIFGSFDPSLWINETLLASGIRAISASSTDEAKELILKENFKAIIAGSKISDWSQAEIINFVRRVGSTPLIFLSETTPEINTDKAKYLLQFTVLSYPTSPSELLTTVSRASQNIFDILPVCELSEEDQEFVSIPLRDFVTGKRLSYDLFIKIGISRFVKFTHGSDGFDDEQVKELNRKDIQAVYLRKTDFLDYIKFNSKIIEKLSERRVEPERKKRFIQQSFSVLGRSVILGEMDSSQVKAAHALVASTMELVFKSDDAFLALELLKNTHGNVFHHSLNVAIYVSMMASQLGWTTTQTQEKLILSALYHDVGLLKLPKVIAEIPEIDHSLEEREIFRNHVARSCEILSALGGFNHEIISIVSQHHEKDSGNGYPMGLRRHQISSLAKVLRIADEFCDFMALQKFINVTSIQSALRHIEGGIGQDYEQMYVLSLRTLFKKMNLKTSKAS